MMEKTTNSNMNPQELQIKHKRLTKFYYSRDYADAARRLLDKLHESGNPIRVRPRADNSVGTLKLQWYHGAEFLIDHLDPDDKYAELYSHTKCLTFRDYIELHIKKLSAIGSIDEITSWKEELSYFFENAEANQKFSRTGTFSEDDQNWIKTQLATLAKRTETEEIPLFFGEVDGTHIMIIRDNV